MSAKNVLLLYGGGGTEHEVSLVSSNRLKASLESFAGEFNTLSVEIGKDGQWRAHGNVGELNGKKEFHYGDKIFKVDIVIPCIHGYPGETGDLQSLLEIYKVPYIGCGSEASKLAFNKISTKLWFDALGIPNTPYIFIHELNDESVEKVNQFLKLHHKVFIKASSQGSSVGVYPLEDSKNTFEILKKAFHYSEFVLVEKALTARELEISAYEFKGKLQISFPGEIICPSKFYSYEEKYSNDSETKTIIKAEGLADNTIQQIQQYAYKAFKGLKLRHLSRIDFFLENNQIYLNEINTFPGLTPISMFPKMLEANGHNFDEFLKETLNKTLNS